MRIIQGGSRTVILTRNYAIKIPSLLHWDNFLRGLLANMIEVTQSKRHDINYCPVTRWLPFGLALVMKRADPLPDWAWAIIAANGDKWDHGCVEFKEDSFGVFAGQIVAIDYGGISPTEEWVISQYELRKGIRCDH